MYVDRRECRPCPYRSHVRHRVAHGYRSECLAFDGKWNSHNAAIADLR